METITLIGRASRLSLLQLKKVQHRIQLAYPDAVVSIITRDSRGDALQDIPLQTVEGSDFFTQDIFQELHQGHADIAVHSLKDMSSEHFFGGNQFAVVDRDDVRDVAIFRAGVTDKIRNGEQVIIGTCSPRREEMAVVFLQKALPQLHPSFTISTKTIRGNVDTRLRKLDAGEYDGIILATAGLNRLLDSPEDAVQVRGLLADKKLMVLPLIECVPAPCQGAIVAEALPSNSKAVEVLQRINDDNLLQDCILEKMTARQYGVGCLQQFGVTSIRYGDQKVLYAAGNDSEGHPFTKWTGLPKPGIGHKTLFSSADRMGSFFDYSFNTKADQLQEEVIYISNYKAIYRQELIMQLTERTVWAAGSKTWLELAKKGIWVQGSADALGLESLIVPWQMPLLGIDKTEVAVITNNQSVSLWEEKGWQVYGTYDLLEKEDLQIAQQISEASFIFWTSFRQYAQFQKNISSDTIHACPYGETAGQLKAAGIDPVVFPTIKAFQQWRQISIPLRNAG